MPLDINDFQTDLMELLNTKYKKLNKSLKKKDINAYMFELMNILINIKGTKRKIHKLKNIKIKGTKHILFSDKEIRLKFVNYSDIVGEYLRYEDVQNTQSHIGGAVLDPNLSPKLPIIPLKSNCGGDLTLLLQIMKISITSKMLQKIQDGLEEYKLFQMGESGIELLSPLLKKLDPVTIPDASEIKNIIEGLIKEELNKVLIQANITGDLKKYILEEIDNYIKSLLNKINLDNIDDIDTILQVTLKAIEKEAVAYLDGYLTTAEHATGIGVALPPVSNIIDKLNEILICSPKHIMGILLIIFSNKENKFELISMLSSVAAFTECCTGVIFGRRIEVKDKYIELLTAVGHVCMEYNKAKSSRLNAP